MTPVDPTARPFGRMTDRMDLCEPGLPYIDGWSPDTLSRDSALSRELRKADSLVARARDRLAALKVRQEDEERIAKERATLAERAAEERRKR